MATGRVVDTLPTQRLVSKPFTRALRIDAKRAWRCSVKASEVASWDEIVEKTKDAPLNGYTRLPEGSKPSTSPSR